MTFRARRRTVLPGLVALLVGAACAWASTQVTGGDRAQSTAPPVDMLAAESAPEPVSVSPPPAGRLATSEQVTSSSTKPSRGPSTSRTSPPPSTTTTTEPPPSSPPSEVGPDVGVAGRVLQLVNGARADAGCEPVRADDRLAAAAQAHSTDMAERGYFSHTTPEGVTFDQRITGAGYPRPGAENIARGQRGADEVMASWMASPGHRANILNCELGALGIGLDTRGWYWTQDFGY